MPFCSVNLFYAGSCGMSAGLSIPSVGCSEHYAPLAPEGKVVDRYHMDGDTVFNSIVYVCVILINFLILLTYCFQKISQNIFKRLCKTLSENYNFNFGALQNRFCKHGDRTLSRQPSHPDLACPKLRNQCVKSFRNFPKISTDKTLHCITPFSSFASPFL